MSSSMLRTCLQLQRARETEVEKKRGHRKAGRAILRVLSSWLVEFQPIEWGGGETETFYHMGPDNTDEGSTFEEASAVHVLAKAVQIYAASHLLSKEEQFVTSHLKEDPNILMMKASNDNETLRAGVVDVKSKEIVRGKKTFRVPTDILDFLKHHEDEKRKSQEKSDSTEGSPVARYPVDEQTIEIFRSTEALNDRHESLWLAVLASLKDKNCSPTYKRTNSVSRRAEKRKVPPIIMQTSFSSWVQRAKDSFQLNGL